MIWKFVSVGILGERWHEMNAAGCLPFGDSEDGQRWDLSLKYVEYKYSSSSGSWNIDEYRRKQGWPQGGRGMSLMRFEQSTRKKCINRYNDPPRAGRSGDRIPVGVWFYAAVQINHATHPTMGNESFLVVRRPERGYNLQQLASRLKKE